MSDRIATLVGEAARRVGARLPELTPELTSLFVDVIPEFRHDEAVRRLMVASTASNLSAITDVLALGISLEDIAVPPAAATYARRFAQHDLNLEALLRAYRLGEHAVLQWFIADFSGQELSAAEVLAATSHVASHVNGYIDQVIEGLIDIYESERRLWEERSDAARAAQVRTVLATERLEMSSAEEMLGLTLRGWHVAAVAWTDPAGTDAPLRAVPRLLAEAFGRRPVTVRADADTVWAWITTPVRVEPKPARGTAADEVGGVGQTQLERRLAEHPGLRIALGEPDAGLAGFRASHQEALLARRVAQLCPRPDRQLHPHAPVALAGLLIDRREDVRRWVRRTLGELAAEDESMARLRETLRVFFESNGSYNHAATQLHLHKNTVLYRVRKAEELLGRPITDGRLSIEVALLACDQLGVTTGAPDRPNQSGQAAEATR